MYHPSQTRFLLVLVLIHQKIRSEYRQVKIVDKGSLGITITALRKDECYVSLKKVEPSSLADRVGVKAGDVPLSMNNQRIKFNTFMEMARKRPLIFNIHRPV